METFILILLIGLALMFVINLGYKFLIKQDDAKAIKQRIEDINKQMKEEQKSKNMAKVNELLSDMLKENNKLMKMTLKPMLVSFVIVLVFLPMVNSAYGDRFATLTDGKGTVDLGQEYDVEKINSTVMIGSESCTMACQKKIDGYDWVISEDQGKIKFARIIVYLPIALPIIGNDLGWLGWYIISSIPIIIILRKLMKIYV